MRQKQRLPSICQLQFYALRRMNENKSKSYFSIFKKIYYAHNYKYNSILEWQKFNNIKTDSIKWLILAQVLGKMVT